MKYFFLLILKKRTNFALRKSIKKKLEISVRSIF